MNTTDPLRASRPTTTSDSTSHDHNQLSDSTAIHQQLSTGHRHNDNNKDQAHPRITILWCPSRALAGPLGDEHRVASQDRLGKGVGRSHDSDAARSLGC